MIYMIAGLGVVKIGFTNDVKRRLTMLQTGHSQRLTIMRVFEGGLPEEAKLHRMFAEFRTRGEWYTFVGGMLGDVGLVEISLDVPVKTVPPKAESKPTKLVSWAEDRCRNPFPCADPNCRSNRGLWADGPQ